MSRSGAVAHRAAGRSSEGAPNTLVNPAEPNVDVSKPPCGHRLNFGRTKSNSGRGGLQCGRSLLKFGRSEFNAHRTEPTIEPIQFWPLRAQVRSGKFQTWPRRVQIWPKSRICSKRSQFETNLGEHRVESSSAVIEQIPNSYRTEPNLVRHSPPLAELGSIYQPSSSELRPPRRAQR